MALTTEDLKQLKPNMFLEHIVYGKVKFVSFHYGHCVVKKHSIMIFYGKGRSVQKWAWTKVVVLTQKLSRNNGKE